MSATICVLLYGDHVELATRCLTSLFNASRDTRYYLRIGVNEPSQRLKDYLLALIGRGMIYDDRVTWSETNIHKYPMMRRLFYDKPIETSHVIWFDDDSYIDKPTSGWLKEVVRRADAEPMSMMGSVYTMPYTANQLDWIQSRPWYSEVAVRQNSRYEPISKFCTGAFWVAPFAFLKKWNWPIPELDHNGGDVMLGELCNQQGVPLRHDRCGVKINADWQGRESKAPRRGFSQKPIGHDFVKLTGQPEAPRVVEQQPIAEPDSKPGRVLFSDQDL